jgi:hypothetical protein
MCFRTKVSLLLLVLFIGAGVFSMNVKPAEAATLAELQQIIEQLKAQILELQERLTAVQQGQEDTGEWCHTFNTNLRYKDTGAEVIALQAALKKQGFAEVDEDASGKFGTGTFSAVVYFQEKYANDILSYWDLKRGTGFVGKSTRTKLNEFYGCGVTPVPECTIGDEKKHTCPDGTQVPWCACVDEAYGIGTGVGWECVDSPENACSTSVNCTDSDGGINKYVKGTTCRDLYSIDTTSFFSPNRFCRTDRCIPISLPDENGTSIQGYLTGDLTEYYCKDGKIFSKTMYCENGCINGACIKEIGTLTCKEECQAKGYVTGICRSWSVVPDAEWGCKDNELNIGQTSDCSVPFGLVGASKTCCCQKEAQEDCRDENYECTIKDIPCCSGLKEVPYAFVGPGGSCIAATCGSICRPCGNGVCDANENKCNCPEDCGEGDENLPPVIDGLTAPTQLKVNEKGVWTIKARDPENGVLSYSVNWGDEYGQIALPGSAELDAGSQTTTFTHSYSQVGIYTIKFIVTDDHQQTANTSTTIKVVSEITPSITVTSPNGGEEWVEGGAYKITWEAKGITENFEIYLRDDKAGPSYKLIATDVPSFSRIYYWNITNDFWGSSYTGSGFKIQVRQKIEGLAGGEYAYDESDNYFSILKSTTCTDTDGGRNYYVKGNTIGHDGRTDQFYTGHNVWDKCLTDMERLTEWYCENNLIKSEVVKCSNGCYNGACKPGITVTSPNGGEELVTGNTHNITWMSAGLEKVSLSWERYNPDGTRIMAESIAVDIPALVGEYSWQVPTGQTIGFPSGQSIDSKYKIVIRDFSDTSVKDASDDYFSIKKHPNTIDNSVDCVANGYYWGPNGCYD